MYTLFLHLHSWSRWFVLLLAVIVIARAFNGWLGSRPFSRADRSNALIFTSLMHLQLVLGLVLYVFLSPAVQVFWNNAKAGMKDPLLRAWGLEHIVTMVLAVVLAQVGFSLAKRSGEDARKHRFLAIFSTLALVLVLVGIPWKLIPLMRIF